MTDHVDTADLRRRVVERVTHVPLRNDVCVALHELDSRRTEAERAMAFVRWVLELEDNFDRRRRIGLVDVIDHARRVTEEVPA